MPPKLSEYELERQQNIEKNRALLQQLKLDDGPDSLGFVPIHAAKGKSKPTRDGPKPVQPRKSAGKKRKSRNKDDEEEEGEEDSADEVITRRMSTRRGRKSLLDPNQTPEQKAAREKEEEARAVREERERLDAEELARKAKQPRHHDLELSTVFQQHDSDGEEGEGGDGANKHRTALLVQLGELCNDTYPRAAAPGERVKATEKERMKEEMAKMKVVGRAKVTQDRIYSMAYHPEKTKDILFFGDKHGQLGIWDARAPADEEEEDEKNQDTRESGKYWRLQLHWPASAKSSISNVKFDPIDAHSVYTSSYDCTIRRTSFTSGISVELFALDDLLISAFDFTKNGHELWISDTKGGVTHLDMRGDRHEARRFQLSAKEKIGCVSLNPVDDWSLLASCNDRSLKLWDVRKLMAMPTQERDEDLVDRSSPLVEPYEVEYDDVTEWMKDKNDGKPATLRGAWTHGFSVSSAYWDPSGTRILSTCYDDHLRVWDLPRKYLLPDEPLKSFRPAVTLDHDCQTGRWLTVFKAQWSQNPDVYPYFSVGDMRHSLKIISADGEVMAELRDKTKITAVQAVTATHPGVIGRAASGNASGRCVLWGSDE